MTDRDAPRPAASATTGAPPDQRPVGAQDRKAELLAELLAEVEAAPSGFDFYALMRRIDSLRPHQPRTGEALRPRQEALRLGQAPELDFAAAPLYSLERADDRPPRLSVRFFGMLGPQGALPLHLTEFVRERARHHDDGTLAHFLDLFHHRMLSFFYRAWAQAQPVVQLDRPENDRFRVWLSALAGAAPAAGPLTPQTLAYHAGWLSHRSAHPERLCKVLSQQLAVPVRLQERIGHWLVIDETERSRLGHSRGRPQRSLERGARLGIDANAGSRVWDRQYRFRLHLGPLRWARYEALLPGGADWSLLGGLMDLFGARDLRWDLQLTLCPEERPAPRLGRSARLGLSCWIGRPSQAPRQALRIRPLTCFLNRRDASRPGASDA